MEKTGRIHNVTFKSKRDFVEWEIKQDIQCEKRLDAWIFSTSKSK